MVPYGGSYIYFLGALSRQYCLPYTILCGDDFLYVIPDGLRELTARPR